MKLWDLMDMDLYRQMVSEKYIRLNSFELPKWNGLSKSTFTILNYTEKAQFENVWNDVTKKARGLVIDENFNVLARPFDKFQNYSQTDDVWLDEPVVVTDKMDGSLGIIFCTNPKQYRDNWHNPTPSMYMDLLYRQPEPDNWTLITRGSYDSDQAVWGREWLNKYSFRFDPAWTYLVEIIYPENRIVVDYGDRRELVWLAARHNETGLVRLSPNINEWWGTTTQSFPYKTLREALACPPRTNAEGYVVYFPRLDYRIKLKQDDYVALHKIVTGLTERRVWELMKEGKTLEDMCAIVPDEWHDWLKRTHMKIQQDFGYLKMRVTDDFDKIVFAVHHYWLEGEEYDPGFKKARKAFAEEVQRYPYPAYYGLYFALLDKKDIDQKLWDLVKPKAE